MSTAVSARRVAHGSVMSLLARWGLAARATIYLLIGVLAVALAFGSRGQEADQRGAFEELAQHTGGMVLVWVIGIGLAAYALWRLSEAVFGVAGDGKKASARARSFARAVVYTFFAVSAFQVVSHSGPGSQAGQQESWSGKAMHHAGGRWAVGIAGAVVVACGLVLAWEGVRRKFEKYLELGGVSRAVRRLVVSLGVVGSIARGVVFALAGGWVISAAVDYNPRKAGGLDRALRELADTPAGPWLLVAVAIGLVLFGVYGFAEARWRRT